MNNYLGEIMNELKNNNFSKIYSIWLKLTEDEKDIFQKYIDSLDNETQLSIKRGISLFSEHFADSLFDYVEKDKDYMNITVGDKNYDAKSAINDSFQNPNFIEELLRAIINLPKEQASQFIEELKSVNMEYGVTVERVINNDIKKFYNNNEATMEDVLHKVDLFLCFINDQLIEKIAKKELPQAIQKINELITPSVESYVEIIEKNKEKFTPYEVKKAKREAEILGAFKESLNSNGITDQELINRLLFEKYNELNKTINFTENIEKIQQIKDKMKYDS